MWWTSLGGHVHILGMRMLAVVDALKGDALMRRVVLSLIRAYCVYGTHVRFNVAEAVHFCQPLATVPSVCNQIL